MNNKYINEMNFEFSAKGYYDFNIKTNEDIHMLLAGFAGERYYSKELNLKKNK